MSFQVPNKFRVRDGHLGSDDNIGNSGAFMVTLKHNQKVFVIASDGFGWEHVSVSRKDRMPTWDEMCQVKDQFWGEDDCVVQYHPPRSDYVNNHSYCLHLWRRIGQEFETPPMFLVGDQSKGVLL